MPKVHFSLDDETYRKLSETVKPPMTVNKLCRKLIRLTVNGGPFIDELMLGQNKEKKHHQNA